jgi:hypothetical protein
MPESVGTHIIAKLMHYHQQVMQLLSPRRSGHLVRNRHGVLGAHQRTAKQWVARS